MRGNVPNMPNATDKANHKKTRYYYRHLGDFRTELRQTIAPDMLRSLHRPNAWKHFALVLRQVTLAALAILLISLYDTILIWLPCSFMLGFIIFDFTVLLHEAIHKCIFRNPSPRRRWNPLLGTIYATLSGLSKTQFTRWHLDHHAELGTWDDDPKRAHLTPKINKRWYKFLYMTPALFPFYFRAAAKEVTGYPKSLQKQIRKERMLTIGFHLTLMLTLIYGFGFILFIKLYAIPYFFVFPIAFTINRVGQHYN
ncbi:hypothetical protein GF373_14045, partial [bacterium]|nr:hypothetical protein [bacterium]